MQRMIIAASMHSPCESRASIQAVASGHTPWFRPALLPSTEGLVEADFVNHRQCSGLHYSPCEGSSLKCLVIGDTPSSLYSPCESGARVEVAVRSCRPGLVSTLPARGARYRPGGIRAARRFSTPTALREVGLTDKEQMGSQCHHKKTAPGAVRELPAPPPTPEMPLAWPDGEKIGRRAAFRSARKREGRG